MSKFSYSLDRNELLFGLTRLTFDENFDAFIVEDQTIAAGAEHSITNALPSRRTPSYYLILRQSGDSRVIDGDTAWTSSKVYLKNVGSNPVTITVAFFGA